ncbi:MAG: guanylate kinase [Gemmatimonadetes bacterium]|nr:guanylate kinase [Gemmatimonadota bacterium]
MTPFVLILSSPSGGGKTTIARTLLAAREDLGYSVSATTRPPREGEQEGADYFFLSRNEFQRRAAEGEFLEWAEYSGHWYGTPRAEVDRLLAAGRHVILDIEVQGARQVRERRSDVVSIFILPPSVDELLARLGARGDQPPQALKRRLRQAVVEIDAAREYDYIVVNADRTQAVAEVAAIIDAEAHRARRQTAVLAAIADFKRELVEAADGLAEQ